MFEPNPVLFNVIRSWIVKNKWQGLVNFHPVALSSGEGSLRFRVNLIHTGISHVIPPGHDESNDPIATTFKMDAQTWRTIDVPAVRPDRILDNIPDGVPMMIKIDVEGQHSNAIRSIEGILDRVSASWTVGGVRRAMLAAFLCATVKRHRLRPRTLSWWRSHGCLVATVRRQGHPHRIRTGVQRAFPRHCTQVARRSRLCLVWHATRELRVGSCAAIGAVAHHVPWQIDCGDGC